MLSVKVTPIAFPTTSYMRFLLNQYWQFRMSHFEDQILLRKLVRFLLKYKKSKPTILAEDAGNISEGNCGGWSWPPDGQVIVLDLVILPRDHLIITFTLIT